MKKKTILTGIWIVLLVTLVPLTALADFGPKPSIVIDFEDITGQIYYVTLLSSVASTGPYSTVTEGQYNRYNFGDNDYSIFLKFSEYHDADGYYFLQYFQNCSETNQFSWGYFPPARFKVLIYFPDSDSFAISAEAYERYAFDSYFRAGLIGEDISAVVAVQNYDYRGEILSLIARIILTIAVELLIALPFAFLARKQLIVILAVNAITQITLNIMLNLINYQQGWLAFIAAFILLEMLVILIEAVFYAIYLPKYDDSPIKKSKPILYAFVANVCSFLVGLGLAASIPGIF